MNIDSFLKTDKSIDVYGKGEFDLFHTHAPHLHTMHIERATVSKLEPYSPSKYTSYIELKVHSVGPIFFYNHLIICTHRIYAHCNGFSIPSTCIYSVTEEKSPVALASEPASVG